MMIKLMGGTSGGQNWWELVDKFSNVLKFEKHKNFSRVAT